MATDHKKAAVLGYPIAHSLSPRIHNYWIDLHGIDAEYTALEVPPHRLEETLKTLCAEGWRGVNLTIPHKEAACKMLRNLSAEAINVNAANTLIFNENNTHENIRAENTDVYGFMQSLKSSAPDLDAYKPHAVIIGAGGAARAAIVALAGEGWGKITLINRTRERAESIKRFYRYPIDVMDWEKRSEALADATLLVNATSLGMKGQPPLKITLEHLPKTSLVTDMVYNPLITPLLAEARKRGNPAVDGLGMLLYQAQGAFEKFFGVRPEVTPELRAHALAGLV